ncbi:MAG: glycosyltransferase family 2 protein [Planctomycetes bacterium]|nr:glycosyltransferase family 2 protein [Planctomycetota bacterium]
MPEPLITIGITCYNEGDWLRECWESVLAQTDGRWAAVMVMDGTTHQRTREVFAELEHPRLRKHEMPTNMGPYPTRNKAFELTETPYHFCLDGDDQLLSESVALALNGFARHQEAGFIYGDYQRFGGKDQTWTYPHSSSAADLVEGQGTPSAAAYRKQMWEQLGGYASELARGNGDYDFLIGAAEAGIVGYHCGQAIYRCRWGHASQVSRSYTRRYHETHEIIVRRHPRFFADRRRRNRFLALGYKRAAWANYEAGDMKRAAELAWAALRHGMWGTHGLWRLVLEGHLPAWGARLVRGVWRMGGRVVHGRRSG